ncbi:MAG TPA: serine/threonine-protein kinase [Candidatus Dormibacteraeota bacterium]|nr:serine/threonine-protein kinase [Candidatus Dormibacteraeota bacterium]
MTFQTVQLSAILGIGGGRRRPHDLLGQYRLLDQVGAGAYAAVYRARHELMGVERAVKVLRRRPTDRPGERERFLHEARVAGRLRHPNVVSVHDCGIAGDGTPYIVMEYVAGRTLAARLTLGVPPPAETLHVACCIAAALDHAHAFGVVHRDVKPANVLLGDDGAIQLADFGIAQAGRVHAAGEAWAGLGTPAYMAPEQRMGRRATAQTDVYALAVVLHEMLTGRIPPVDGRVATYLPAAIDAVLARGLAHDPSRRPASAGALVRALALAMGDKPAGGLRRLTARLARAAG